STTTFPTRGSRATCTCRESSRWHGSRITMETFSVSTASSDLFRQVPDYAIFLLDARGTILSWNVGARKLYQWTGSETVGRSYGSFFSRKSLREARERGHFEADEVLQLRKDG